MLLAHVPTVTEVVSLDLLSREISHEHGASFAEAFPDAEWHQGDVQDLLMFESNGFDGVICWGMLQNVPNLLKALSEFTRVTKKGGLVSIRLVTEEAPPDDWEPGWEDNGSSGYVFKEYWRPSPAALEDVAHQAGLIPASEVLLDEFGNQVRLFEVA